MCLVFNLAFCGSVAGNELNEAYWKIRGVYVYEREWELSWLN
jgi:hypothetical protein